MTLQLGARAALRAGTAGCANVWQALRAQPHSTNHRIFRAVFVIAAITGLAKMATAGKELFIADKFGRADAIDAFLIAFVVPAVLVNVVSGALSAAFVPTFIHIRESRGPRAAQQLLDSVMICSQTTLLLISVLVAVLAPYYLPLIARGFPPSKLALACRIAHDLSPYVFLNGLVVIWTAVLNAGERFAFAAATPMVTPAATVAFLFVAPQWGIHALTVGTIAGTLIEAGLLSCALRQKRVSILPRWGGLDVDVRTVGLQYVPMLASSFLMASTVLVDQAMAAMLGAGSVAALNYGSKIVGLLTTLGATSLSTAVLPYFSQMVARGEWRSTRRTLRLYTCLVLVVTVPVALVLFWFAQPLVRMLFQRGQFTSADTHVVAAVQAMLVLQLPFYAAGILGVRLISSLRKNQILTLVSFSNLVLHIVLNWIFMRRWGVAGIALSTTIVQVTSCALIYAAICSRLREGRAPSLSMPAPQGYGRV